MVKKSRRRTLSVYSNLSKRRKSKKDVAARRRAEYLASLPKHPVKRLLHRLHPKRFWGYWFSKRGIIMALKITGVLILLIGLLVGALFAYFRKDLDQIRPGEIDKRVQSTVTKYYDRNDKLLWEDKGDGDYKLVVESDELSDQLKQATIAIEDKDFYTHAGVSISGTVRAAVNNVLGGDVQGGSTLTQQLVKQVFFADEAYDRSWGGIPRKIKELILAVEIERMYDKDQILTLYLNESPYGGRRNGAESGAQTYFGKHAKDLSLAESALLAAIPQNPSVFDPYNVAGHNALIARQHQVLNNMAEQGYVTQKEADAAKNEPILDTIKPESSQYAGIEAPHFVQMVRSQLESELGTTTVGRGGLTVKTTLDIRIQHKLEQAMDDMFSSYIPDYAGFTNGAATVEDTQTGQIIAMMGSRDFEYPGYGQDNAAIASIQPGSTIKGLVYSELFQQKPSGQQNYGSGSILRDEPIKDIYGSDVQNADRQFKGDIPIRTSLATSRNIPAIKAMYISGVDTTLNTIHNMGATSYCTVGNDQQVGLAAAIGGCGVEQIDLVNGYASLARMGVYKPQSSILKVTNSSGDVLKQWKDTAGEQIIDQQSAYIVTDILSDVNASAALGYYTAKNIPGVKTATKTGTSDKGGNAKDLWMMSYSPVLTMGVWLGNSDTSILRNGNSSLGSPIVATVMEYAHKDVYAKEGKWKSGDWFTRPNGIQQVGNELYPSWWNKNQGKSNAKLTFDKLSKKKATNCTPDAAKIELDVVKSSDPVTNKPIYTNVPSGYDATKDDDKHKCSDSKPSVTIDVTPTGVPKPNEYTITVTVSKGTFALGSNSVRVTINGSVINTSNGSDSFTYEVKSSQTSNQTVTVNVQDSGYYTASASATIPAYTEPDELP